MSQLSDDETAVLRFLRNEEPPEDYAFYAFAPIMAATGMDHARIRTACRSLRAKGLLIYRSGLITEDGDFYGSGYALTSDGLDAAEEKANA